LARQLQYDWYPSGSLPAFKVAPARYRWGNLQAIGFPHRQSPEQRWQTSLGYMYERTGGRCSDRGIRVSYQASCLGFAVSADRHADSMEGRLMKTLCIRVLASGERDHLRDLRLQRQELYADAGSENRFDFSPQPFSPRKAATTSDGGPFRRASVAGFFPVRASGARDLTAGLADFLRRRIFMNFSFLLTELQSFYTRGWMRTCPKESWRQLHKAY
jgi:hypothetical protein